MAGKRNSNDPHARGAGGGAKRKPSGGRGKARRHYAERTPTGETPAEDVRPTWWKPFFSAYGVHGTKTTAARLIGTDYRTILSYLAAHPGLQGEFDDECRISREEYVDRLDTEANRRGVLGWMEPVVFKGRIMQALNPETNKMEPVVVRKFSDRALELAMRRASPDTFRSVPRELGGGAGAGAGDVAPVAKIEILATGPEFVPPEDDE